MNSFASLSAIALLAVSCAGKSALPATTALAPRAQPAHASMPAAQTVELRHFYLLSPGQGPTLVVTRSELAPAGYP